MKKNLYYQHHFRRANIIKDLALSAMMGLGNIARVPLEVFIRRNFGERYFSFSLTVIIAIVLALFPFGYEQGRALIFDHLSTGGLIFKYITWYAYLIAFLKVSWDRRRELKRLPSVFDFERFSLSTGLIDARFFKFKFLGKYSDIRRVEILVEPALFLIIGFALAILQQTLGYFLMFTSILYSGSYVLAYHIGDHYIMDKIDEQICSESLVATFVDNRPANETKGFRTYGRKPADPELRRKVANSFFAETDDFAYVS